MASIIPNWRVIAEAKLGYCDPALPNASGLHQICLQGLKTLRSGMRGSLFFFEIVLAVARNVQGHGFLGTNWLNTSHPDAVADVSSVAHCLHEID